MNRETTDYSESDLIEVQISDLSITNIGFAVFLKIKDASSSKVVPIFIGPLETHSISTALDGSVAQRPNSHDLFVHCFKTFDIQVVRIVIDNLEGSLFYSSIYLNKDSKISVMDARPSDAIAIALRTNCSLFIHKQVYEKAAVSIGGDIGAGAEDQNKPPHQLEKLRNHLQQAIEKENFEKAAELRDKIRKLETEN